MKKIILLITIVLIIFDSGFSMTEGIHGGGHAGIVFPQKDVKENYSGRFILGGSIFYKFNKINASLDYVYFGAKDATPYSKNKAKLEIHHFFLGPEVIVPGKLKNVFLGGGLSINFLTEEVESFENFKSNKASFFVSTGTRFLFRKYFIGIKMIWNFLKFQDARTGGLYLMISAGL